MQCSGSRTTGNHLAPTLANTGSGQSTVGDTGAADEARNDDVTRSGDLCVPPWIGVRCDDSEL
jgi:hypothetical protein